MKVGTKSVLFGAHCFFLHPIFVAIAWTKLYGFPFDPRLWVAFFVHDLGYLGKPNMDGKEGETHVELGAKIMRFLFDTYPNTIKFCIWKINLFLYIYKIKLGLFIKLTPKSRLPKYSTKWSDFSKYHSRYYAKKDGAKPSKLCFADKLSFCVTPRWLYLPMVNATGEIHEYLKMAKKSETAHWKPVEGQKVWHKQLCEYMTKWVEEHKDGREDTWTNSNRHAITDSGVYK
jgi:hypothetical protein